MTADSSPDPWIRAHFASGRPGRPAFETGIATTPAPKIDPSGAPPRQVLVAHRVRPATLPTPPRDLALNQNGPKGRRGGR